jgi:hypothetical protein
MRLTTVTIQHHPGAIILESLVFFGVPQVQVLKPVTDIIIQSYGLYSELLYSR